MEFKAYFLAINISVGVCMDLGDSRRDDSERGHYERTWGGNWGD